MSNELLSYEILTRYLDQQLPLLQLDNDLLRAELDKLNFELLPLPDFELEPLPEFNLELLPEIDIEAELEQIAELQSDLFNDLGGLDD